MPAYPSNPFTKSQNATLSQEGIHSSPGSPNRLDGFIVAHRAQDVPSNDRKTTLAEHDRIYVVEMRKKWAQLRKEAGEERSKKEVEQMGNETEKAPVGTRRIKVNIPHSHTGQGSRGDNSLGSAENKTTDVVFPQAEKHFVPWVPYSRSLRM